MRKRTKAILGLVVPLVVGLGLQPVVATGSSAGSTRTVTASPTTASPTNAATTDAAPTNAAPAVSAQSGSELVVGLGDSLTYRPASWFRRTCSSGRIGTCVNAGVTGNTTAQMYDRLDAEVLAEDPDVLVLMGGANDIRQGATTTVILGRLARIVDAARADGVPVVISTVPPQDLHGPAVLALNRAIRSYATATGVPLLDMCAAVGTAKGTYKQGLSDDGLHPDRTGFARMARISRDRLPGLIAAAKAA